MLELCWGKFFRDPQLCMFEKMRLLEKLLAMHTDFEVKNDRGALRFAMLLCTSQHLNVLGTWWRLSLRKAMDSKQESLHMSHRPHVHFEGILLLQEPCMDAYIHVDVHIGPLFYVLFDLAEMRLNILSKHTSSALRCASVQGFSFAHWLCFKMQNPIDIDQNHGRT